MKHTLVHATDTFATVNDLETDEALVTIGDTPRVLALEVFVMAIIVACTEGFAKHPSLAAARVPPLLDFAFSIVVIEVVVVVVVVVIIIFRLRIIIHLIA